MFQHIPRICQKLASTLALLLLFGCSSFGPPKIEETANPDVSPTAEGQTELIQQVYEQRTYELPGGRQLKAVETGNPDGPLVVYVHGSPGSSSDIAQIAAFPNLSQRAKLVAIDRLGWGGSSQGGIEPSLAAQADAIRVLLEANSKNLPAIVVGHSLGGAIVARLAMDFPDLVGGVVILAGSIDPALEKTTWYQAMGRWRIVRWAVPDALRAADLEIKPLKQELELMLPLWPKVQQPVSVVQGEKDSLVPKANADFAERMLQGDNLTVHRIPKRGHFLPWKEAELISTVIERHLNLLP